MGTSSSEIRPGLALADTELSREATSYLRTRLHIFYVVMAIAASSMYVLSQAAELLLGVWTIELVTSASSIVHLLSCVTVVGVLLTIKRCPHCAIRLRGVDVIGLHVMVATLLAIYAIEYRIGIRLIIGVMAVFIVSRAVVIPSTARTTLLVSLPSAIGVLVIQLAYGTDYGLGGAELTREFYLEGIIWNQATIWFGIGVATVASRVNFSLRSQAVEARQFGQYRLEEKIGRGGMGEVYRATHAMLRRSTAVKILRPDLTGEDTIKRFHREVRETSRLSSPCTIRIYDYGRTADGLFYYAMEYLDGADLSVILDETGAMPAGRVIHLLDQVCRSLAEAHGHDLVHRDLKAGNVMVCRRGGEDDVVKVVDFGLVRDVVDPDGSLTQVGAIVGTPETLAPEVINGDPATGSADLYALGIVGYQMVVGEMPFTAKAPLGLIRHHLDTVPDAPCERKPGVPEDLSAIVMKLLAKDPAERFESASAVRKALAACNDAGSWSADDASAWWERWGAVSRTVRPDRAESRAGS